MAVDACFTGRLRTFVQSSLAMIRLITGVMLLLGLTIATATAQPARTPIVNTEYTRANGQRILLGHCTPAVMRNGIYGVWYYRSYQDYTVNKALIQNFAPRLEGKSIEIFAGSWCGDTRREIPRLIKILETAGFDTTKLTLIFVDNSKTLYKQSPQHEEVGKAIHRIPTIIVYDGKNELGRIVETPVRSLEEDLADILSGAPYRSKFFAITYWLQLTGADGSRTDRKLSPSRLKRIAEKIRPYAERAADFNGYSLALAGQERLTEAINVLELNTLIFPADPTAYIQLARLYIESGEYNQARERLTTLLAIQPDHPDAIALLDTIPVS